MDGGVIGKPILGFELLGEPLFDDLGLLVYDFLRGATAANTFLDLPDD